MNKVSSNLNLVYKIYESNLSSFILIHSDMEKIKSTRIAELELEVSNWSEKNVGKNEKNVEALRPNWIEDHLHYTHHIDWLILNSFYISAFSMFEYSLKRICEIVVKACDPKIRPDDIKGNGEIDSFRKYFHLVFGLEKASSDYKCWGDLLEYKAIRNALVHSGGLLNKERKKDLEKVKGYRMVTRHNIWHRSESIYLRIHDVEPIQGFSKISCEFMRSIIDELLDHELLKEA
jgi:hypothetical protein